MPSPAPRRPAAHTRARGAVAVEAAIITPLLLLLVLGIVEFGLVFKDKLAMASAVRAGARTASAEPRNAAYATDAAAAVANASTALDRAGVTKMWVYRADSAGRPAGGFAASSCTDCVVFRWDSASQSFVQTKSDWAGSAQNACPGDPAHDSVGIYLQTEHAAVSGLFFDTMTLDEHAVMALEPLPVTSGCRP